MWLSKLDLIKVLEACTPETKSTIEFCLVVSNLLALNDEDNQAARMDYGIQICESNITQTVMENFLISEHQHLRTEGLYFMAKIISFLVNLSNIVDRQGFVELHLCKLVLEMDLLAILSEKVF